MASKTTRRKKLDTNSKKLYYLNGSFDLKRLFFAEKSSWMFSTLFPPSLKLWASVGTPVSLCSKRNIPFSADLSANRGQVPMFYGLIIVLLAVLFMRAHINLIQWRTQSRTFPDDPKTFSRLQHGLTNNKLF